MEHKERCAEIVFPRDAGGASPKGRQCTRNGSVWYDGVWFCGQHDPVRLARRSVARREAREAERELRETERRGRYKRGSELLQSLGVDGSVQPFNEVRPRMPPCIVIPFEEAEALLARLTAYRLSDDFVKRLRGVDDDE